jgi:hypothetical protein
MAFFAWEYSMTGTVFMRIEARPKPLRKEKAGLGGLPSPANT